MKLTIISVVQILLLVVFLDPVNNFELGMAHVVALTAVIAALGVYAIFIGREKAVDERDDAHRQLAGRVAFHVGAALLTVAIAIQSVRHELDPWLVVVLVSMIVAKTGARLYADRRK
jgi:ABC-type iron transport system FetAB permease component